MNITSLLNFKRYRVDGTKEENVSFEVSHTPGSNRFKIFSRNKKNSLPENIIVPKTDDSAYFGNVRISDVQNVYKNWVKFGSGATAYNPCFLNKIYTSSGYKRYLCYLYKDFNINVPLELESSKHGLVVRLNYNSTYHKYYSDSINYGSVYDIVEYRPLQVKEDGFYIITTHIPEHNNNNIDTIYIDYILSEPIKYGLFRLKDSRKKNIIEIYKGICVTPVFTVKNKYRKNRKTECYRNINAPYSISFLTNNNSFEKFDRNLLEYVPINEKQHFSKAVLSNTNNRLTLLRKPIIGPIIHHLHILNNEKGVSMYNYLYKVYKTLTKEEFEEYMYRFRKRVSEKTILINR